MNRFQMAYKNISRMKWEFPNTFQFSTTYVDGSKTIDTKDWKSKKWAPLIWRHSRQGLNTYAFYNCPYYVFYSSQHYFDDILFQYNKDNDYGRIPKLCTKRKSTPTVNLKVTATELWKCPHVMHRHLDRFKFEIWLTPPVLNIHCPWGYILLPICSRSFHRSYPHVWEMVFNMFSFIQSV